MDRLNADRVISFSYKPDDKNTIETITKLKRHASRRGITFSFIIIKALKNYLDKLENE
jgi:hypothetical protein